MRTECQRIISNAYLSQLLAIAEHYIYISPQSLPDHSLITPQSTPQSLPGRILIQFTLQFLILLSWWRCRLVFICLECWSCTVKLLTCLICFKLEPSFKYSLYCYRLLFSEWKFKKISHWISTRVTLQHQPTKRSNSSAESRETSLSTYHIKK